MLHACLLGCPDQLLRHLEIIQGAKGRGRRVDHHVPVPEGRFQSFPAQQVAVTVGGPPLVGQGDDICTALAQFLHGFASQHARTARDQNLLHKSPLSGQSRPFAAQ